MSLNIKARAFVAAVRDLAEASPDFVYDGTGGCLYARYGVPSCLLGRAMSKLGVSTDSLEKYDGGGRDIKEILLDDLNIGNQDVAAWADRVQGLQDTNRSWGLAVELADDEVPIGFKVPA